MDPSTEQGSNSGSPMPQINFENAVQWPTEFPLPSVANIDGLSDYVDLTNIIEGLEIPTAQTSAFFVQPSNDSTARGQGAITAPATHSSGKTKTRVIDDEKIGQRRAERQKQYRERQRQGNAEIKKQFSVTAVAVEAARAEQDTLLVQETILKKAVDYCSASISAARSLVSNTVHKVRSEYQPALVGLAWLGLQVYSTDAQLHAYIDRSSVDELDLAAEDIIQRSHSLLTRWEAEPESRGNIEAHLGRLQSTRMRCMVYLAKTRPGDVVKLASRRLMPIGADGAPNPKLVEAFTALELTPGQLDSFKREWLLYIQRTESVRQHARSMISLLTSSMVKEDAASFSSIGAAGLFLKTLEAVQELETQPTCEVRAVIRLGAWATRELSAQQKVGLMTRCVPFYPDFIQIGRIAFGDGFEDGHERTSLAETVHSGPESVL
jgi:hypothetical protein